MGKKNVLICGATGYIGLQLTKLTNLVNLKKAPKWHIKSQLHVKRGFLSDIYAT